MSAGFEDIHFHCSSTGETGKGKNPMHYKRKSQAGQKGFSILLTNRQEELMIPDSGSRLAAPRIGRWN